ncbi:MAG: hypothetical protein ABIQ86_05980 [Steroidobacteraceae bacterium]
MTLAALQTRISEELGRTAPEAVNALAAELAHRGGGATVAVLYYGSALRAESLDGVLDFYVLLDNVGAWPGSAMARVANRLLPPNVGYLELTHQGQPLRAKYAVMSSAQFQRRLRKLSLDTTIWARFCQPVLCVWVRSPRDRAVVVDLVSGAVTTAAWWAIALGPATATAADFWRALFAHTYAAELRVEKAGRPQDLIDKHAERYADLLALALHAAQVPFHTNEHGALVPALDDTQRRRAHRSWALRERLGRPLNILRLLKAAFTFEGAMDYVAWKIERHRGVRLEISPWQRRFPLLAAPGLYWQLRRRGILR